MKITKDESGERMLYFDKEGNSFLYLINEWSQLLARCNWYSFTLIDIDFENDIMCPGYEFTFIVLGLGFRLRINRDWSGTILQSRLDEVESGKAKLIPYEKENQINITIPEGWRRGQWFFNFLEFLQSKGLPTEQNTRLADSFHISDEDWEKYLKEFNKKYEKLRI